MFQLIAVCIVAVAFGVCQMLFGVPERPAYATKLTVREMCRGPGRPDWCREHYTDLLHGREVREKETHDCTTDADCRKKYGYLDDDAPY